MSRKSEVQISSNRSFGLLFFLVFLIIGLWPLLNESSIRIWSVVIAIIFLILGLLNSKFLTPLNKLWFRFGLFLGSIVAPIVMGAVFYLVVTPTGLIFKIMNKDLLNIKFDNKKKSYWVNRSKIKTTMKQQF
tara:strand:- start:279 stop:674 length:396 start_codon:yes stop_codon:yes gene_type:complete